MASDAWRAELRFLLWGQQVEFHVDGYDPSTPINTEYLETMGSAIINWALGSLLPILSNEITLYEVFMTSLDPSSPAEVTVTEALPATGASASGSLPSQIACIVSFITDELTARGRGRIFIPGMPTAAMLHGLFTGSAVTGVSLAIQALIDDVLPGVPSLAVTSVADAVARPVVAFAVRTIAGGLNRRRIGRGS